MTAAGQVDEQCDVAIVGYGPVGQALAALLGRAGHDVIAVERYEQVYPLPRAVHLDHEVMRILQNLGVARQLEELMLAIREYRWFGADGEPIFTMRSPAPAPSGWEPDYMFFQPQLERALDALVRAQACVSVRRGWIAHHIEQAEDHVELAVSRAGEQQRISARYLLGADGANSMVRAAASIGVRDLGFRERWLVADVLPNDIDALGALPDACQWCDPRRPHMHARNGIRHRRWEFMLLAHEQAADFADPARTWQLLERFITPTEGEITRHAVYEFRSMLAERMRTHRLLIAGDAAHQMPPFMGQGLCSGLRDALNIAWKLDLVLGGRASPALLDTVTAERQGQNESLIDLSVAMGRVSCELDPAAAAERDRSLRAAGEPPPLQPWVLKGGAIRPASAAAPDQLAGELSVQGHVRTAAGEGLFDDVVARGLVLIARRGDPAALLSPTQRELFGALGASFASLDQINDLDGRLTAWLDEHGSHAVIVRPDFYVFGSCAAPEQLPALVDELLTSISTTKENALHD